MRFLTYLFLLFLGLVLLTLALANRQAVTLTVLPDELARFAGWSPSISLPLFAVIFGGIVAGVLIGFVWEWLREYKFRSAASTERREKERLAREVRRLKGPEKGEEDEILALMGEERSAR
ncbi:MAG: LapA family protein [Pseudomonadota bacterium]